MRAALTGRLYASTSFGGAVAARLFCGAQRGRRSLGDADRNDIRGAAKGTEKCR
jgi:hypothetical protein